jgi:hypothetical protein
VSSAAAVGPSVAEVIAAISVFLNPSFLLWALLLLASLPYCCSLPYCYCRVLRFLESLLLLASPLFSCSAVDTAVAGVLAVVDVPLVAVMAIVSAVVTSLLLLSRLLLLPVPDVVGVATFGVPAVAGSPPLRCRSCCSRSSSTKNYLTMSMVIFSAEGLSIFFH